MFCCYFLALPVHTSRTLVIDLHAVHAYVAFPRFRIARNHARQRNEPSSVPGPALQDGKIEQGKIVALDHFFAWARGHGFWEELAHLGEHGQHFYFVEKALRRLNIHEGADAIGNFVQRIHFKRQSHAASGAKLID